MGLIMGSVSTSACSIRTVRYWWCEKSTEPRSRRDVVTRRRGNGSRRLSSALVEPIDCFFGFEPWWRRANRVDGGARRRAEPRRSS